MNGQEEQKLINVGLFIFVILILFMGSRAIVILPGMSSDDICKFEYGDNWIYDYNHFGRTCIELDYISLEIINRTQLNITIGEAKDKYCNSPGFWELSEWEYECKDG